MNQGPAGFPVRARVSGQIPDKATLTLRALEVFYPVLAFKGSEAKRAGKKGTDNAGSHPIRFKLSFPSANSPDDRSFAAGPKPLQHFAAGG